MRLVGIRRVFWLRQSYVAFRLRLGDKRSQRNNEAIIGTLEMAQGYALDLDSHLHEADSSHDAPTAEFGGQWE